MNAQDLLNVIGEAKGEYVWQTQQYRSGEKTQVKRFPGKRLLLIAAVVSLLAMLVGCAVVYVLRLKDMQIAETEGLRYYNEEGQRIEPTEVTKAVMAVRGIKDSPNYLATVEWYEFEKAYDPDYSILMAYEDYTLENYEVYQFIYGCYSQEMVDKVNEIAGKYGLKLLSQECVAQRWQTDIMFDALGIDGVCREENATDVSDGSGVFYANGNFSYDFEFKLPQENGSWEHEVWAYVEYSQNGYFHPITCGADLELYEEWNYTTSQGVDILIAQNYAGAILVADLEDSFMWVRLDTSMMLKEIETPTKQDVERMAEVIDFTISPDVPENMDAVQKQLEESNAAYEAQLQQQRIAAMTYGDYGAYLCDQYRTVIESVYYTLLDLNGDGVDDLLLGDAEGNFTHAVTIQDGVILDLYMAEYFWLCEDGVVATYSRYSFYTEYFFNRIAGYDEFGGHVTNLEALRNDLREDFWTHNHITEITSEEAESICAKYIRKEVFVMPLMEYPVDAEGTTLEQYILANTVSVTEAERLEIYGNLLKKKQESDYIPATHYLLMDITGDGEAELLLTEDGETIGDIYTVENGEIKTLAFWTSLYLCENGILEQHSESQWQEFHSYFTVGPEGRTIDRISHPMDDAAWYRSADGDSYYELVISEEEYNTVAASYVRLDLNWIPVSEFPCAN